jgi:hypothetical protein
MTRIASKSNALGWPTGSCAHRAWLVPASSGGATLARVSLEVHLLRSTYSKLGGNLVLHLSYEDFSTLV